MKYFEAIKPFLYAVGFVVCLAFFLGSCSSLPASAAPLIIDFEYNEGYEVGALDGQEGWVKGSGSSADAHSIECDVAYSGNCSAMTTNASTTNITYNVGYEIADYATSSEYCVGFYQDFIFQKSQNVPVFVLISRAGEPGFGSNGSYQIGYRSSDSAIYLKTGNLTYETIIDKFFNWYEWNKLCISWDQTSGVRYYVNDELIGYYNYIIAQGINEITLRAISDPYRVTTRKAYFDLLTQGTLYFTPIASQKFYFYTPNEFFGKMELRNDQWNDFQLFMQLNSQEALSDFIVVYIKTYHENGVMYPNAHIVPSVQVNTDPNMLIVEREHNFPDGGVVSRGTLIAVDDCAYPSIDDGDCRWTPIAEAKDVYWTASSTGYSIFDPDFPWKDIGFTPWATSTFGDVSEEDNAYWAKAKQILDKLWNIFPFSIANQIKVAMQDARDNAEISAMDIKLQDLLHEDISSILGEVNPTIMSVELLNESELWKNKIYPTIEMFVYVLGFIIIMVLVLPGINSALSIVQTQGGSGNKEYRSSTNIRY